MTMQEHAPAPHMKGVVWEYFRGGNRDGPGHYAGGSSASRSGPAGAGFCPAWAKPGGLGARLGRGRRGRSRPGRAERLGRGSRTGRGQGLGGAGRVLASGRVLVPVSGACPERWRRWSGARVGVPASGAWAGLPCHPATACPVACLGAHGMGRGRGRAAHHDPTATAQGCRVAWCVVVPVSHGHIAGRDAVPTDQPGRGRGAGCPRRGGVGRRWRAAWDSCPVGVPPGSMLYLPM